MQTDLQENPRKLSGRHWAYLLLFNGISYLLMDIIVLYETVLVRKGSGLSLFSWSFLILLIPLGVGLMALGTRRLREAKRVKESGEPR